MTDFDELRDALGEARRARDGAVESRALAREELARARAREASADRSLPADEADERERLKRTRASAEQALAKSTSALARAGDRERAAFAQLSKLTDPRDRLKSVPDDYPCLLFPVRLETRFKTVGRRRHQLWVRVYPDTCVIDTFEPMLSEVEVASARAYWQGVWRAAGVEEDERGAWRGLVASHGAGRATWIVEQFRPLNAGERPTKAAREELVLVIAVDALPAGDERAALEAYWPAAWRAEGDAALLQAVRDALDSAVGADRASELIEAFRPYNLDERPPAPPAVRVAFVVLPTDIATKRDSWTSAADVSVLPDRFVLVAFSGGDRIEALGEPVPSPLAVGPDPSAPPDEQLRPEDGDLVLPDDMSWLVDFERAVKVGMAFKVDLTGAQAEHGIDRLMVLGVRLSGSGEDGGALLEELLGHHQAGHGGFALLPQGTPTNNTEQGSAGFTQAEDADAAYDALQHGPLFTPADDPLERRDGQWLADLLGIDPMVLGRTPHADGTDQVEARAMQTALWPATLGYFLKTMMDPVVGDREVDDARWFFTRHVSGRGPLPAIRIGSQPYGLLVTTAFSRLRWLDRGDLAAEVSGDRGGFLQRLAAMLDVADKDWRGLSDDAAFVGRDGDPHATLLEILGLHPSSVEFHQRYAQSLSHLFNHLNLAGLGGALMAALAAAGLDQPALDLLARLGHTGPARPAILDRYFLGGQTALHGPLIDDRPLSETAPIRAWAVGERNYIQWLIERGAKSLDDLRRQTGFLDDRPPTALLYLLLRHALLLAYHDAGYRLHETAQGVAPATLRTMRAEPEFVHVADRGASESRWATLYAREARITGSTTTTVAEHIADVLPEASETEQLREQLDALGRLADVPTARLERAFAEHVDCCGYRFDAWRLGLANLQLEAMRSRGARRGIHLGAYGWLEDVRPRTTALAPVTLPDDLGEVFGGRGEPRLMHDEANGGYIHAPSLDHATTAAILRSGYLANASPGNPGALAVNLSSERVRTALSLLEGMREGQSLGALLGYRLERGLHDAHGRAEVDELVYVLRKAFPLRADRLAPTRTPEDVEIKAVEARNVVDGLRLVEHVEASGVRSYPFGLDLRAASPGQQAAIDAEVERLLDLHDALADLGLAEGVHQAVLGNYDRVAATLESYTSGSYPPEPDVVRTPTTGTALTHRIGLHLDVGAAAVAGSPTPRSIGEPALNAWLGDVMPPLDAIACRVTWIDPVTSDPGDATVTMRDLGLQPIDLLTLVRTDTEQAMTELDDRIVAHVLGAATPRPDTALSIHYMERPDGQVSVFEVAPLVTALRALVAGARPLRAGDVALTQEATQRADEAVFADRGRVSAVWTELDDVRSSIGAYLDVLQPLLEDQPARRQEVLDGVDGFVDDAADLLARAARFGVPQAGWGFAYEWRRGQYAALLRRLRDLVHAWDERLTRFAGHLAEYHLVPATAPLPDRLAPLRNAELEVATAITPEPATPDDLLAAVVDRRDAFAARRDAFAAIVAGGAASLSTLLTEVRGLLPVTDFVAEPFALEDEAARIVAFAGDLAAANASVGEEVRRRLEAAQALLDGHDAATAAPARVKALEDAAKALLGDDFQIVPEFALGPEQGAEWRSALDASDTTLLSHLRDDLDIELPVDEWLYGAARVRAPLRNWEQAVLLAGGFGRTEPELKPIQLPSRPGDPWLAMRFPSEYAIDGERLLYTAHYAAQFDESRRQCGLLLDEWTEVIPGQDQPTGVAFHFDRPGAEAPQSLLVVTPASWDGAWHWDDLVGAVEDTFVLARQRAVEPDRVDGTPYARFLPATVMAAAASGVSIATTLALNNDVLAHRREG